MKITMVALAILALVAVTHANFSGSLVNQAKPLLSQAGLEIKEAIKRADLTSKDLRLGTQFQDDLIATLQQLAEAQLNLIQNAIQASQQVSLQVVQQLQQILNLIQSLSSEITEGVQTLLQNLLTNLLALADQKGQLLQNIQQLITGFNLPALFQQALELALQNILSSEQIQMILAHLSQIGSGLNKVIEEKGLADFTSLLSGLMSLLWSFGGNSFVAVQSLVTNFFEVAAAAGNVAIDVVAEQLLNFLRPFKWVLGKIYCQVVIVIGNIIGSPIAGEDC